jgi:SM-20-related protein
MFIEHIIDLALAETLEIELRNEKWQWGSKSTEGIFESIPHWHRHFAGPTKKSQPYYNCESELNGIIKNIWEYIKPTYFLNDTLVRCYANAITTGIDQRTHTDDPLQGSKTLIIYVNKTWNVDWCGDTILWDRENRTILSSILPKFNCGLLINGNQWHGVRPVSAYCHDIRMTLMFKTRPTN